MIFRSPRTFSFSRSINSDAPAFSSDGLTFCGGAPDVGSSGTTAAGAAEYAVIPLLKLFRFSVNSPVENGDSPLLNSCNAIAVISRVPATVPKTAPLTIEIFFQLDLHVPLDGWSGTKSKGPVVARFSLRNPLSIIKLRAPFTLGRNLYNPEITGFLDSSIFPMWSMNRFPSSHGKLRSPSIFSIRLSTSGPSGVVSKR